MVHRGMLLEGEELGHPHRAGPADPGKVVPQQVHNHHVLGPVLRALGQRAAERRVVHRRRARAAECL